MSLNALRSFCALALWSGAATVLGAGGGEPLQSHDSIRARVQQHLETRLTPEQRADARIDVSRLDSRLRLPACDNLLQTFATGSRPAVGAVTVGVRCQSDKPWTLYVSAQVVVFGPALVAAQSLPRGTVITDEHVRVVRKDLSKVGYGWLSEPGQALGKVAKRPLVPGQIVQPSQLEAPKLIRRGEQVIVRAASGGLELTMTGKALSDGVLGQRIRVQNLRSQRIIEAEVVEAGVVRVRI